MTILTGRFGKTVGSGAAMLVASTVAVGASVISPLPDGDFNFGARSIDNVGSTVSIQAVRELREVGREYTGCVLASFKQGGAVALPGILVDQAIEGGASTLEAIEDLQYAIVNRESYLIDAAYIVVAQSPDNEYEDFVRISVGAPQQEGETELYVDGVQISPEFITYEYSGRAGHPGEPEESYSIRINDPETVAQIKDALTAGTEITMVARSVNSDFVLPSTYQSVHYETGEPVDISEQFNTDCLTKLEDINIPMGTFPAWGIGSMLTADMDSVLALANAFEDEAALANIGNYQIAPVLWTEGMFAISPFVLQEMMDGEVVSNSMGEYIHEDLITGLISVSPDVLEFYDNDNHSCSCVIDFLWPDAPSYGTPSATPTGGTVALLIAESLIDVGLIDFSSSTSNNLTHTVNEFLKPVPLPISGLLLAGAVGGLFRRQVGQGLSSVKNTVVSAITPSPQA